MLYDDILNVYNLDYDDLIDILYKVSNLVEISVEDIVRELDEIESLEY